MAFHKPFLSNANRLRYPKLNNNSADNQWQCVLWSGESKFEIFASNCHQYVRSRSGERYDSDCLRPSGEHRGSVMVWGSISASRVEDLVKTDKIMNPKSTARFWVPHITPSGKLLIGNGFKHTADAGPVRSELGMCEAFLARDVQCLF